MQAPQLQDARLQRANLKNILADLSYAIGLRKLAITPDTGWPGGNDATRKVAELKACTADDPLQELLSLERKHTAELTLLDAKIEGLEDYRRDEVLANNAALAYALYCANVPIEKEPLEYTAFAGAAVQKTTELVAAKIEAKFSQPAEPIVYPQAQPPKRVIRNNPPEPEIPF